MKRDAKADAFAVGGLLPTGDDVALRADLHRVPGLVLRVPKIKIVVMHALGDHVPGPGPLVERHELVGIPLLGLPARQHVLVAELARMADALEVVRIDAGVAAPGMFWHVDPLGIPIAVLADRLRSPVQPHANLGFPPPLGLAEMLAKGFPGRLAGALGDRHLDDFSRYRRDCRNRQGEADTHARQCER